MLDSKKIGETLVELRKKKGVTVTQAANAIGITASALSNYENGSRIPRDNIKIAISDYYKKSVNRIFFS